MDIKSRSDNVIEYTLASFAEKCDKISVESYFTDSLPNFHDFFYNIIEGSNKILFERNFFFQQRIGFKYSERIDNQFWMLHMADFIGQDIYHDAYVAMPNLKKIYNKIPEEEILFFDKIGENFLEQLGKGKKL
ncbi:MAG: hypothetical protein WC781_00845 [Candidatus Pacearchaeota archaeon]|jgi:hypothetical protein